MTGVSKDQPYEIGSIDFDEIDRLVSGGGAAPGGDRPQRGSTRSGRRGRSSGDASAATAPGASGLDVESLLADLDSPGAAVSSTDAPAGAPSRRLARGSRVRKPALVGLLLAALGCVGFAVWGAVSLQLIDAAVLAAMGAGFARAAWTANRALGSLPEVHDDGTPIHGIRILGRRVWLLLLTVLWTLAPVAGAWYYFR